MGKEDSAIKQWLSNEVRYADLFNAVLFDGKQIIKPESLQKLDGESSVLIKNKYRGNSREGRKSKKRVEVKRFRDIVMSWNNEINLAVLACEAQSYIDYTMPFRAMFYDGMTYNEQKNLMWSNLSDNEKKESTSDERLSNFRKKDKLVPTITIVFYYKDREWDGALNLHDMIDFRDENIKNVLKKYIPNYHVNLINLNKIEDFSKFKSDLHIIFNMLKYKRNKQELYDYTMKNAEYFKHISNDSIRALGELLNAPDLFESFIEEGKDEQDMCKALYDLINDSKSEGREEGREEGKALGAQSERDKLVKAFINGAKRLGYSKESIKEALEFDYGLSAEEIEMVL